MSRAQHTPGPWRDRASDLRAIADGRLMLHVRNGVTVARSMLAKIADEFEAMSTALAAKDAELAEVRQQYVDANEARIDAEAQLAERGKPFIAALEAQPAERAGGVNEDALRALAQAYDREDAAQRGEPDPWNLDDPGDIGDSDTWVSERIACARAAAEAFLSTLSRTGAVKVKALDEDDYEEIISAAAINMRKATSGTRGQVITVQDSIDWWVMKETERRILSALTAGKPEQVPSGWQPMETAPADGRVILVYEARSAYPIHLRSADGDWWRKQGVGPSHWMPLPAAPTAGGGDAE